jgi:hypothetical protein
MNRTDASPPRSSSRRNRLFESLEQRLLMAAGVVINEFLANNNNGLMDEDGERSDWIELRNTDASAVNLGGWYLTDDSANFTKWPIPSTSLAGNGYLVVFASGKNRTVAGQPLHTNFSLDAAGEYLALVRPDQTIASEFSPTYPAQLADVSYGVASSAITTDLLVDEEASVRLLVPSTSAVDNTWRAVGFNDSSWYAGTTGIGYDTSTGSQSAQTDYNAYINTNTISLPSPFTNMRTSTGGASGYVAYTRVPFLLANKDQLTTLKLRMRYDDGFVAYINGVEVARKNFTGSPIFSSSASATQSDAAGQLFEDFDISASLGALQNGNNVLAIAGLNNKSSSTQLNDFLMYPLLEATRVAPPIVGYQVTPTPGAANLVAALGVVADTHFSVDRGFYNAPFTVQITTSTAGAQIRYTTDGSDPTATSSFVFDPLNPVSISHTTTLRAAAFKPGFTPTNIDTQTYIFPTDVILQTGAGLQATAPWGHLGPDYEMDPNIVNSSQAAVIAGLTSIPTVSLVMPWDHWFGTGGKGIYIYGGSIEKAVSVEYFNADGTSTFHQNGSVQIQGGTSDDRWKDDKLSMRVKFKAPYGPTKLDFPLFTDPALDNNATSSFDTLILDGVLNNSWVEPQVIQNQKAMYVQDQVIADLQNLAGGAGPHGKYVQLYLNGLYWGMYYLHERPDESFAAAYLGGDKNDYDVVKHNGTTVVNGDTTAAANFSTMLSAVRAVATDPNTYNAAANLLDTKAFADYVIINYYGSNNDWAAKNWYASYNRASGKGKWRFHSWDAEHVFEILSDDRTTQNQSGSPTEIQYALMNSPEYRQLFQDEVQRLMFNGGLLTPQSMYSLYGQRLAQIDQAMYDESARWGDNQRDLLAHTYTHDEWKSFNGDPALPYGSGSQTGQLANYFPQRTNLVLNQFIARGWLGSLAAPLMSQFGGNITPGFQLTLSKPADSPAGANIYYTLNGTDPRAVGGALTASALLYNGSITLNGSTRVLARIYDGSTWSPIVDARFLTPTAFGLRISELNYHPAPHTGVADPDDMEFIELVNTGDATINLQGCQITTAIDPYTFGNVTLAPGARIIVARKPNTFTSVYGTSGINLASPGYAGKLADGGERIVLLGPLGETIEDFTYGDSTPWPAAADGAGSSLEIIDPLAEPSDPTNWRASYWPGGSPGKVGYPPPTVLASNFLFQTGHSITIQFDHAMDASTLSAADLDIQPLPTGATIHPTSVIYNATTNTATFTFATPLLDSNYRATLSPTSVADPDGNNLAAPATFDFYVLAGDANHDRVVDVSDLGILATFWQESGRTFASGDFNYDGMVDVSDLGILATNWQKSLAAPSARQSSFLPTAAPSTVKHPARAAAPILTELL